MNRPTTQDEELATAMGLPSDDQVIELLAVDFSRAGVEIESVRVVEHDEAGQCRITVVIDADTPPDLETVVTLSRTAAQLLDDAYGDAQTYELEVTTPGVDRPLTTAAQFRRVQGRLCRMRLIGGEELTGRVGIVGADDLRLVVRKPVKGTGWAVRDIPLADIDEAVVQVEFSPPNPRELELAGAAESGGDT